jgi:hypothetical protein
LEEGLPGTVEADVARWQASPQLKPIRLTLNKKAHGRDSQDTLQNFLAFRWPTYPHMLTLLNDFDAGHATQVGHDRQTLNRHARAARLINGSHL